jgi:hypothetical protein
MFVKRNIAQKLILEVHEDETDHDDVASRLRERAMIGRTRRLR